MAQDFSLKYELVISDRLWEELRKHLFPGDHDEHGAIIAAGVAKTHSRIRLLVRNVFPAVDGVDYIPGQHGYRMLTAEFVRDHVLFCRDEQLAYLAVHNHSGRDAVQFSLADLRSHERGYPALREITRNQIVGGVVFAQNAAAGDLWISGGRVSLESVRVVGRNMERIFPSSPGRPKEASQTYDRQARVFGDRGQAILSKQRVGIIGLGGVGSIVCEYLSRLGVGSVVLVDPDRVDPTSTPRVVGSSPWDAIAGLSGRARASWFRRLFARLARLKVDIAAREARRANPAIEIIRHASSVVEERVARSLSTCDYLFLAADSMQARLVFNSLVHQYLIPGIQLGAKVPVDPVSGKVGRVYGVVRPVLPGRGCLWCNGLITSDGLQQEALSPEERKEQRYVEDDDIPAPSVVTLNALAAAHGVNDYLFRSVGLRGPSCSDDYIFIEPRTGTVRLDTPRRDSDCPECGAVSASRFARGDGRPLPVLSRQEKRASAFRFLPA